MLKSRIIHQPLVGTMGLPLMSSNQKVAPLASHSKYNVAWNSYSDHLRAMMCDMLETDEFADVTLVCDDLDELRGHRNILSAASPVFRKILTLHSAKAEPVIYLRGIESGEMRSILNFIYRGESVCSKERIAEFFAAAKNLEIKELSSKETQEIKPKPKQENVKIQGNWAHQNKTINKKNHDAVRTILKERDGNQVNLNHQKQSSKIIPLPNGTNKIIPLTKPAQAQDVQGKNHKMAVMKKAFSEKLKQLRPIRPQPSVERDEDEMLLMLDTAEVAEEGTGGSKGDQTSELEVVEESVEEMAMNVKNDLLKDLVSSTLPTAVMKEEEPDSLILLDPEETHAEDTSKQQQDSDSGKIVKVISDDMKTISEEMFSIQPKFKCEACNIIFESHKNLRLHQKIVHREAAKGLEEERVKSPIPVAKPVAVAQVSKAEVVKPAPAQFSCDKCKYIANNQGNLTAHQLVFHRR